MYSALGQQAPMLQRTNPDGSTTWYFGPVPEVVKTFPDAAGATVIPEAQRQAIEAGARGTASLFPVWALPVAGAAVLAFFLMRR